MCIFFCANSIIRDWLDSPPARESRERQRWRGIDFDQQATIVQADLNINFEEPSAPGLMHRSAWVQAYFRYRMDKRRRPPALSSSPQDWQKALDVLANAWCRILSRVGLR